MPDDHHVRGNLLIRKESGDIWVTPARIAKGAITRDDTVLVLADGAGSKAASSLHPSYRCTVRAHHQLRRG